MPLSGPPALLSAVAAAIGDLIAGTDTSKYVTPAAYARVTSYLRNALAPAQALSFDGTAGATIANTQVFGTGDFSWVVALSVASFADSNFILAGDTNAHVALISTSGSVIVGQRYGADLTGSGAGTIALNTPVVLGYTRSGTTGKYYLNGALVATITDTLNYSGATTAFGKQFGGSQYFNGTLRLLGIANRALSAAEVLSVYQTGSFPSADFNSASNTAIYTSNFSAGTDSWGTDSSRAVTGNVDSINGSNDWLKTEVTSGPASLYSYTAASFTANVKKRVRVAVTIFNPSGSGLTHFVVRQNDGTVASGSSVVVALAENTEVTTSVELLLSQGSTRLGVGASDVNGTLNAVATGKVFYIKNFTVYPLGLLVAPESNAPGNGYLWNDQSGNGAHILLPGSGVSWTLPSNAQNVIRGKSNTNGNQQLFGAGCIPFGTVSTRITRILAKARSGAPAVTLGYISGGNQYGTTTTLAAYWKDVTLGAEAIAQTSSLWAGSNSTDIVDWVIFTQPISV